MITTGLLFSAALSTAAFATLPQPRLKAVLFDIDGTLFNSDDLHMVAFQELLRQENFVPPDGKKGDIISEAFFREKITGRQNSQIVADLFPAMTKAEGASFSERKEARFRELAAEQLSSLATPGLAPLLQRLEAAGVACAAVTNAPRANAELMLGAIGRLDWFKPLVIGDECSHGKPHPEPYLAAMRTLGVDAADCLAVEDSPSGAIAAVKAGVRTIGITSTQTPEALLAAGCAFNLRDFEDLELARELESWLVP